MFSKILTCSLLVSFYANVHAQDTMQDFENYAENSKVEFIDVNTEKSEVKVQAYLRNNFTNNLMKTVSDLSNSKGACSKSGICDLSALADDNIEGNSIKRDWLDQQNDMTIDRGLQNGNPLELQCLIGCVDQALLSRDRCIEAYVVKKPPKNLSEALQRARVIRINQVCDNYADHSFMTCIKNYQCVK